MSGSGPKAGRRPPLGSVSLVSSDLQFLQDSLTGALSAHQPGKRLQGHGPQILAGAAADRDRAVFHIPVADHQHEGLPDFGESYQWFVLVRLGQEEQDPFSQQIRFFYGREPLVQGREKIRDYLMKQE